MSPHDSSRDLLVKLYDLRHIDDLLDGLEADGISIRRALAPEKYLVRRWVGEEFGRHWEDECTVAFDGHPGRCFIATTRGEVVGFCVYDSIALGVTGPLGVAPAYRRKGVARALITQTLLAMRNQGYAYAVLGWTPVELFPYYRKIVGASEIPGSSPYSGMYRGLLTEE